MMDMSEVPHQDLLPAEDDAHARGEPEVVLR
jgi:hypothetical protein